MRRAPLLGLLLVTNATLALIACGSRTGFLLDDDLGLAPEDAASGSTCKLSFIGGFNPPQQRVEFTGTGDGRLFGFSPAGNGGSVIQVDKTTGDIIASDVVPAGGANQAFAFAFWGGDFWIFTGRRRDQRLPVSPGRQVDVAHDQVPDRDRRGRRLHLRAAIAAKRC